MIQLRSEDIIAISVIVCCTILRFYSLISAERYLYVIGIILSFYFGRTYQCYIIYRGLKAISGIPVTYERMIRRFGSVLLISGITLLLEKYVMSGASLTYPPILDHGLWGLILIIAGWILLIRKEKGVR